jgi:hypothetical protein
MPLIADECKGRRKFPELSPGDQDGNNFRSSRKSFLCGERILNKLESHTIKIILNENCHISNCFYIIMFTIIATVNLISLVSVGEKSPVVS